jgi:hypothetical protein
MKNDKDDEAILIDTTMKVVNLKWNPNGEI